MKVEAELQTRNPGECASKRGGQQVRPSKDAELENAALNAIECLTTVPLETLKVSVRDGRLHLRGTVSWEHQRAVVDEVARHVPGVREVIDSITIEAPEP